METKLFIQSVLSRRLHFSITQLQGVNFDTFVQSQAKLQFENVCIDEGFIRPNSLKVISISTGILNKTKISFEVMFECEIFYPMNEAIIFCKAVSSTKAGVRAISANEDISPFVAFITREHNLNDKDYLKLEKNETFYASILASRYELNDKQVSIIGKFARLAENTKKRKTQQSKKILEEELQNEKVEVIKEVEEEEEVVEEKEVIKEVEKKIKKPKGVKQVKQEKSEKSAKQEKSEKSAKEDKPEKQKKQKQNKLEKKE